MFKCLFDEIFLKILHIALILLGCQKWKSGINAYLRFHRFRNTEFIWTLRLVNILKAFCFHFHRVIDVHVNIREWSFENCLSFHFINVGALQYVCAHTFYFTFFKSVYFVIILADVCIIRCAFVHSIIFYCPFIASRRINVKQLNEMNNEFGVKLQKLKMLIASNFQLDYFNMFPNVS